MNYFWNRATKEVTFDSKSQKYQKTTGKIAHN